MNVLDIVCFLIIIFCTLISVKKGFLISVLNLIAVIGAGIFSKILSQPVADFIYVSFIKDGVVKNLYEIMPTGSVSGEANKVISEVINEIPDFVLDIAERFGIVKDNLLLSDSALLNVDYIESSVLRPVIVGVAAIIAVSVLFVVFSFIFRLVVLVIRKNLKNDKHKLLNSTDSILGGLFGLLRSIFPVGLICLILNFAASNISSENFIKLVNESFFCRIIQNIF